MTNKIKFYDHGCLLFSFLDKEVIENMSVQVLDNPYKIESGEVLEAVCVQKIYNEFHSEKAVEKFSGIINKAYKEKLIGEGFFIKCGVIKLTNNRYIVVSYPLLTGNKERLEKLIKNF